MNRPDSFLPLFLLGVYAISAQLVLLRELFVLFAGNELYIGLVFSSWLLWASIGSAGAARSRRRRGDGSIDGPLACAAILPVLTIAALRILAGDVFAVPGEILAPGGALLLSVVATAPSAVAGGYLFGRASRRLAGDGRPASLAGGTVYGWESVGSGIAGVILGVYLFDRAGTFISSILVAAVTVATFLWRLPRPRARIARLALALLPFLALFLLHSSIRSLDRALESRRLAGYEIAAFADSPYGRIDAVRRADQSMLFINNIPVLTSPDPAYAEERVHIALSSHPAPRTVLVLGACGGDLSTELMKYRLERVTAVVLDARAHALADSIGLGCDPAVDLRTGDIREFVRSDTSRYDVVILVAGEPLSLQENRFFTREFFTAVRGRISPGGILALALPGSENLMLRTQAQVHACVFKTLSAVFPSVAVLPGGTVHFIAGADVPVSALPLLIPQRLEERGIAVSFLQPAALAFRFSETRMAAAATVIDPPFPVVVNDDFGFSGHLYTVIDWYNKFGFAPARRLSPLIGDRTTLFVIFFAVLAALYAVCVLLSLRRPAWRVAIPSIFVAGFSGMAGGIAMLVAFQIVCGVLYQWVAALTGVFMLGAGGGSFVMMRRRFDAGIPFIHFSMIALFLCLVTVLLIHQQRAFTIVPATLLFMVLEAALGILTGAAFVAACRLAGEGSGVAPVLYAVDLSGGLVGAALFAGVMLPLAGLPCGALLLAGINAVALIESGLLRA